MNEMETLTFEVVRGRLMELHPDVMTALHMSIASQGHVIVQAFLHPEGDPYARPWHIYAPVYVERGSTAEQNLARAFARVLAKVEAGEWDKPVEQRPGQQGADPALASVHAG